MPRSGSTLQYQIVTEIVESTGKGMTIGYVDKITPAFVEYFKDISYREDKFLVVKCHNYTSEVKNLAQHSNIKFFYSYRDIRDVVVSLGNKFLNSTNEVIKKDKASYHLYNYYQWTSLKNIFISEYNSLVQNMSEEIIKIAKYLQQEITLQAVQFISEKFSLDNQIKKIKTIENLKQGIQNSKNDIYDPVSQLHNNHIRSGKSEQWKQELSSEQIEYLENLAFSWLIDRGYNLSTIYRDKSQTAPKYAIQARNFMRKSNYIKAETSYKQAILSNSYVPFYHYGLGSSFFEQNKINEAVNAYRYALYLKPNSALFNYSLGVALYRKGNFAEAIAYYRKAIKLQPNSSRLQNKLGEVLLQQDKLEEAKTCFQKAIELDSKFCWSYANMAKLLKKEGKFDLYNNYREQALSLYPHIQFE